jgi:glucokinase
MILAGDIGGTSTRLAYYELESGRLKPVAEKTYPSKGHKGPAEIVAAFVAAFPHESQYACFGIAGPVLNGRVETPNLPWIVDAESLARSLKLQSVTLINDLEANAYGISALEAHDFVTLNEGSGNAIGNAAVISAGTGLGEAGLYWDGKNHHPFACEGGHADFAARDAVEVALLEYLRKKFGHVSVERVLSGPGLHSIYDFLRDSGRATEPAALADEMRKHDPSAVIARFALEGKHEICVMALDLFISIYGAEAGNLALKLMAGAGVYVGGGIAPKIISKLKGPLFLHAFREKGRMRPLLEAIPVRVILNDKTALLGAGQCAARLAA